MLANVLARRTHTHEALSACLAACRSIAWVHGGRFSLITSYQKAIPGTGKLVFCTRTVPEMSKALEELRRVLESPDSIGFISQTPSVEEKHIFRT